MILFSLICNSKSEKILRKIKDLIYDWAKIHLATKLDLSCHKACHLMCRIEGKIFGGRFDVSYLPIVDVSQQTLNQGIHNEICLAIKEDEMLSSVTTWINLKDIMLSEINEGQNDKNSIISFICGI